MLQKDCKTCGDSFDVIESRADSAKFCSRECYHEGQRIGETSHSKRRVEYVKVECVSCGDTIEKPPSRANRSERQFCDQNCYLEWNKSYQKKESGRRQRIRDKESSDCEVCGFSRYVEMAHIIPASDGGTYHKNNILFLCPNHHRLLDSGKMSGDEFLKIEDKIRLSICQGYGWKNPEESEHYFNE